MIRNFYKCVAAIAFALAANIAQAEVVTVGWANVAGNEGFVVESKPVTCASGGTFTVLATVTTNVNFYIGGNFTPSSSACVRVAALVGGVAQTFSAGTDVTIADALLPAPNSVTATSP